MHCTVVMLFIINGRDWDCIYPTSRKENRLTFLNLPSRNGDKAGNSLLTLTMRVVCRDISLRPQHTGAFAAWIYLGIIIHSCHLIKTNKLQKVVKRGHFSFIPIREFASSCKSCPLVFLSRQCFWLVSQLILFRLEALTQARHYWKILRASCSLPEQHTANLHLQRIFT